MFFLNFHFRNHKQALSHDFAFWLQCPLFTSDMISPKTVLDFYSILGTLLNFLKNLWNSVTWQFDGLWILLLWLGQGCLFGPIHFSQHCRASSAVAQSKQTHNVCLSASSRACTKRSRWRKQGGKSYQRPQMLNYTLGFWKLQTAKWANGDKVFF